VLATPAANAYASPVGRIVALFLLNGVGLAVFMPFAPAILAARGFSAEAIGLLGALVSVVFVASAWVWGHLADVVIGRSRALRAATLLSAALLAGFALPLPIALLGVVYVAYAATSATVMPLSDALAVNALSNAARQYGPLRGLLSGTFAVTAVGLGFLYATGGYGPAVPIFVVVALPVAALAGRLPDVGKATIVGGRRGGAMREALRIQPRLPAVLLAIALASIGVFAGLTFLPLRILQLGGGPVEIAFATSSTAIVELAVMPLVSRFLARTGLRAVLAGSCLVLAGVFAWFAVAPSPLLIVIASLAYGVGWSGLWVGSVTTMRALLPASLQGSGQSLLSVTTGGLAAFIANAGGGLLWAGGGAPVVFGIVAAAAVAAALVGWWSFPQDAQPVGDAAAPGDPAPQRDPISDPPPPPRPPAGPAAA
jgi:MFS transporter, PPP family, 3-phenylpropionic acid transporter